MRQAAAKGMPPGSGRCDSQQQDAAVWSLYRPRSCPRACPSPSSYPQSSSTPLASARPQTGAEGVDVARVSFRRPARRYAILEHTALSSNQVKACYMMEINLAQRGLGQPRPPLEGMPDQHDPLSTCSMRSFSAWGAVHQLEALPVYSGSTLRPTRLPHVLLET